MPFQSNDMESSSAGKLSGQRAFTLIKLMLVAAIISVLATPAYASYQTYIEKTKTELTISDIGLIESQIDNFWFIFDELPINLNTFNFPTDPWGNPYQYLNMSTVKGNGQIRKDKNLMPINTDYELYSSCSDGQSVSPLTTPQSKDDIIRANNGSYAGIAEDY